MCSNGGREVSIQETRLTVDYRGTLHRSRRLQLATNCEQQSDGAWKCQLRYARLQLFHNCFMHFDHHHRHRWPVSQY